MSLRPGSLAFNPRPRRLSTPSDAFELHPDVRSYGTTLRFADDCLKIGVEVHVHKMPLNAHLKVKSELLMGMMDIVEKHTSGVAFPVEVEDPYAFETKKRFGGSVESLLAARADAA